MGTPRTPSLVSGKSTLSLSQRRTDLPVGFLAWSLWALFALYQTPCAVLSSAAFRTKCRASPRQLPRDCTSRVSSCPTPGASQARCMLSQRARTFSALLNRSKVNQSSSTNILKLQGVNDTAASRFYAGKVRCGAVAWLHQESHANRGSVPCRLQRVAYIYKAKSLKNGTKFRAIWGRITRPHGTAGSVRAQFAKNLPPKALGGPVRVMLYPSTI